MTSERSRLSADELSRQAGLPRERLDELVAAGVIGRSEDGGFDAGDVQRVRLVGALEEAGIGLDALGRAIAEGLLDFAPTDAVYVDPGPMSDLVLPQLAERLGLSEGLLAHLFMALGLPRPSADARLRHRDVELVSALVTGWRRLGADDDVLLRAARSYGEGLRRAAEGWIGLFEEIVMQPLTGELLSWDAMNERAVQPGREVLDLARRMLGTLFERHLEQLTDRINIESIERSLALAGIRAPMPTQPPAIVFADLAGYTRLTEDRGDRIAAEATGVLAAMAEEAANRHGGRVVKLLGDGVMLYAPSAARGLAASLDLVDAARGGPIPPVHVGVAAGPVIRRDADFFGRTVNLAARLSAQAGAHEVLATKETASLASTSSGVRFEARGSAQLKGIADDVAVVRVSRR